MAVIGWSAQNFFKYYAIWPFDEYIFCEHCGEYVIQYCAIHGPLLIVKDDPIPKQICPIPRAILTLPTPVLYIARSDSLPGAGLGVYARLPLPKGVRFGPYKGQLRPNTHSSIYSWQIFDNNIKPSFSVDAADENNSNWMRYVNCSRYWWEQNLVAFQYRKQIYYRTVKRIPRNTELLVYFGSQCVNQLGIDLRRYHDPQPTVVVTDSTTLTVQDITAEATDHQVSQISDMAQQIATIFTEAIVHNNEPKQVNTDDKRHNLKKIKNHIGKKPYKCNICSYKTAQNSNLKTHIRTHTGEKPYKCNICSYKTTNNGNLKTHIRTHTGEKPYKCNICSYETTNNSHLKTHIRTHTGEKPYKCNICSYKTAQNSDLKKHIRTHTGEKPFKCNICSYETTNNSNLKTHIKIKHT